MEMISSLFVYCSFIQYLFTEHLPVRYQKKQRMISLPVECGKGVFPVSPPSSLV